MRARLLALAAAALAVLAAACSPTRVDIVERPPAGFVASASAEPGAACSPELRQRVSEEANYHCDARGRRAVIESKTETMTAQGCQLSISFSCGPK